MRKPNYFEGKHQYDATVGAAAPKDGSRTKVKLTVWADNRNDALQAACALAADHGCRDCTVNHITQIR
jgi:hypothetical protein